MNNENKKLGSIHPTIDVCGTQKTVSLESATPFESGESELANGNNVGDTPYGVKIRKLLKKYHYSDKSSISSKITHFIHMPCPFCVKSSAIIKWGKRRLKNGKTNQLLGCLGCGKKWTERAYWKIHYPDYIIDYFLDLLLFNPKISTRNISKKIYEKHNLKICHTTIFRWIKRYRKNKLYDGYMPNSKLNKIAREREKVKYIPKVVEWESKLNGKIRKADQKYGNGRINRAREFLKKYDKQIVKANILREAGEYGKQVTLSKTKLIEESFIKVLGNGFYYINYNMSI